VEKYLVVRDLSSTNGIRINGKRVTEGKLDPGDELAIGNYRYRIHWGDVLPDAKAGQDEHTFKGEEEPVPAKPVDEDEQLESCDEPVPLREPGPPVKTGRSNGQGIPPAKPAQPVLPDELDLAPISDAQRRRGQPPPLPPA
jgi:pSer/pThr/pTyr-binding forkhead associated (FHA) protein